MNRFFLIGILVIISGIVYSQNYEIDAYNNQTVTTCTGTFYDSGGQSGGYAANENYKVTFCPGSSLLKIKLNFTSFGVSQGDFLTIYNGPNITSPLYGIFDMSMSPVGQQIQASASNTSGCLTCVFISQSTGTGWKANISCVSPCQLIYPELISSIPAINPDSVYIDLCLGDTLTLTGGGLFPENNLVYQQSNASSTFIWKFGNGTSDTGQTVQVLYDTIGGYDIDILIIDTNGCKSYQDLGIRARISTMPTFDSTFVTPTEICLGDTASFTGFVIPTSWQTTASLNMAGQTYLPDGSGTSYTSTLNFNIFNFGQTLTNINDLVGIFASLEHSFLGDLQIKITCPSNVTVVLKQYPGGGGTYLGEPIDNNAQPIPGVGYLYSWKPNPTYNTMVQESGSHFYSYINALGISVTNHAYLPAGSYQSYAALNSLVGCPLNGNWTLSVKDNIFIDNGYIFNWGIEFDQSILPTSWGFTPGYDPANIYWQPDPSIVSTNGNTIEVKPTTTGYKDYTFVATDSFGCTYDTTISVFVRTLPAVDLGPDIYICYNDSFPVITGDTGANYQYLWMKDGAFLGVNQTLQTDTIGNYVLFIDSAGYCSNSDTIFIGYQPLPQATFVIEDEKCGLANGSIQVIIANDTGQYTYAWNTIPPQNTSLASNLSAGTYMVTIDDGSCIYIDTFDVIEYPNPVTSFSEIIDEICGHADGSATVNVSGATPPVTYIWNTIPPQTDSIAVSLSAGTYIVTVSDSFCTVSDTVTITNYPGPDAEFIFTPKTAQMPFPKFTFEDITTGNPVAWNWDFGDYTGYSTIQNPFYTYSDQGKYVVLLEVKDINGCTDTVSHILEVKDASYIYIPNTFTPLNKDGLNDDFIPLGHNMDFENEFEMYIYDRWGQLVYFTDKYKPWNGKPNNSGDILEEGVYMYKIFVRELGGLLRTYSGSITLL